MKTFITVEHNPALVAAIFGYFDAKLAERGIEIPDDVTEELAAMAAAYINGAQHMAAIDVAAGGNPAKYAPRALTEAEDELDALLILADPPPRTEETKCRSAH